MINIVPLHFKDRYLLKYILSAISDRFQVPSAVSDNVFSLEPGRDLIRNQINSNWILSRLLEQNPKESDKIIGLTEYDLYSPVLTYVFGEAQLNGQAAVVSSCRFRDELYGLHKNYDKLKYRLEKEVIHELGHTFGLVHCREYECVMNASTYVEEIDLKTSEFCLGCSKLIRQKK